MKCDLEIGLNIDETYYFIATSGSKQVFNKRIESYNEIGNRLAAALVALGEATGEPLL